MRVRLVLATLIVCLAGPPAFAQMPDRVFIFGDSLSDTGNAASVLGGGPETTDGRSSNGPVWVDEVFPTMTFALSGEFGPQVNYAVGGAQTGSDQLGSFLLNQVTRFEGDLSGGSISVTDGTLAIVWIGANDYWGTAQSTGSTDRAVVEAAFADPVATAIDNTAEAVTRLIAAGIDRIAIITVPRLGSTPLLSGDAAASFAGDVAADLHNAALAERLDSLRAANPGTDFRLIDSLAVLQDVTNNPAANGFTNVTDPCFVDGTPCSDSLAAQNQYLYWDDVHPTTAAHAIIGERFAQELGLRPAVPETGWYLDPAAPGRGYAIEVQGDNAFYAAYLYEADGSPYWLISLGSISPPDFTRSLDRYEGGQTLDGAFVGATLTDTPGDVSLTFSRPGAAQQSWPGETIDIQRYDFDGTDNGLIAPPDPNGPENGWWYNPDEPGQGWFIEFQGDQAFIAGYFYREDGTPIWGISLGTGTTPSLFEGTLLTFEGGQCLGCAFSSASQSGDLGTASFSFDSRTTGSISLQSGRVIPIERFRF